MTEITRQIEIAESPQKVWSQIDPSNWPNIFSSVKEVNGSTNGQPGVGTRVKIVAGEKHDYSIQYNIEITEFKKMEKIAYRRFGGPLPGKAMMQIKPLQKGVLFVRTSYYDDDLSDETMQMLCEGMEKDNARIKELVESKA